MISYYTQFILCSALFFSIYQLILQQEKNHQFKRFYLIVSPILSLTIPFLSFEISIADPLLEQTSAVITEEPFFVNANTILFLEQEATQLAIFTWENLLVITYFIVSFVLFIRFLVANWLIMRNIQKAEIKEFGSAQLVLHKQATLPYSYLNYIFISRKAYQEGLIDREVLEHELAHVKQRHSLDLLLIELLLVVFWINPLFFLFRNAIKLNHEFLADEAVIRKHPHIHHYQRLLLSYLAIANDLEPSKLLSSSFNYFKTKKRLEMMTKKSHTSRILLKQFMMIPVVLAAILLFSKHSFAQSIKQENTSIDKAKKTNLSAVDLQEAFDQIVKTYIKSNAEGKSIFFLNFSTEDRIRLIELYQSMSSTQQAKQRIKVVRVMPLEAKTPSSQTFEQWKNASRYGVWIDGKRVSNSTLNQYKSTDISNFWVSKLYKNATNYGKHEYQLDLTSKKAFDAENIRRESNMIYRLVPNVSKK